MQEMLQTQQIKKKKIWQVFFGSYLDILLISLFYLQLTIYHIS